LRRPFVVRFTVAAAPAKFTAFSAAGACASLCAPSPFVAVVLALLAVVID